MDQDNVAVKSLTPYQQALQLLDDIRKAGTEKNWEQLHISTELYNNLCREQTNEEIPIPIINGQILLIKGEFEESCKVLQDFIEQQCGSWEQISGAQLLLACSKFKLNKKFEALKLLVQRSRRPEIQLEIDADKLQQKVENSILSELMKKAKQSGSPASAGCSTDKQQPRPVCQHQLDFLRTFIQDPASSFLRSLTEAVPATSVIGLSDEIEYTGNISKYFELENDNRRPEGFDPDHDQLLTSDDVTILQKIHAEFQKPVPSASILEDLFRQVKETNRYMVLFKASWMIGRGTLDKATDLLDKIKLEEDEPMFSRAINVRRGLIKYLGGELEAGTTVLEDVASEGSLDAVVWLEKLAVDQGKMIRYSEWARYISLLETGPAPWHIAALIAIILNTKGSHQKTCFIPDYEDILHRIVLSCKLTSKTEYLLLAKAFAIVYTSTRVCVLTRITDSATFINMVGMDEAFFVLLEPIAMDQTNDLIPIFDGMKLKAHLDESRSSELLSAVVDRVNHQQEKAENKILNMLENYDTLCCCLSGVASCKPLLHCYKQFCSKISDTDCPW